MTRRRGSFDRRALDALALQLFARHYARKAQPHLDPNDRRYDRSVEAKAKSMRPEQLDALLRHGEDE